MLGLFLGLAMIPLVIALLVIIVIMGSTWWPSIPIALAANFFFWRWLWRHFSRIVPAEPGAQGG